MSHDLMPPMALVAIAHDQFRNDAAALIAGCAKPDHVVYDLKNILPRETGALSF